MRIYKKPGINVISTDFMKQRNSVLKSIGRHLVKLLLKESQKVVSSLNNEFETLLISSFPKDFKVERDRIVKRGKNNFRSLQDKRIKEWRNFERNSFKYDSERRINVDNRFKFLNFTETVKRKSKVQTNGSQPEAHVKEELMSPSNVTCNISSNQLEISNIREGIDNGIQKRELVDLEGVVETSLEQSYEKSCIVTKFKDSDRNNEETDIETQTLGNITVRNSKKDSEFSNNKKDVFPNVSYANIFKQTSGMRRPSNLPAYGPRQLTSPISQVSKSDLYLTQGDQSFLKTLETLCGSANGHIKGNFVSEYIFNLSQKTLAPLEIKVLEKGLGFSPATFSINEVDLRRDISDFSRKMRCK